MKAHQYDKKKRLQMAPGAISHRILVLGFRQEGILRQRHFSQSHFDDEHYFGLLKDEWHRQRNIW